MRLRELVTVAYDLNNVNLDLYPPTLELVVWEDHHSTTNGENWKGLDKIANDKVTPVHSVGWRVFEDNKTLVLVSHVDRGNGFGFGNIHILKKCITYRKTLHDPTKPKKDKRK